ncbi:MAG: mobilization protein [Thalassobius sp.]|nr:mobilization protein [Thalassovita sp.]
MEESKELQRIFNFFQGFIYMTIIVEIMVFILVYDQLFPMAMDEVLYRIKTISIYQNIFYSKLLTFFSIMIVSIGTKSRKQLEFDPLKQIGLPLLVGSILFFGATVFYFYDNEILLYKSISLFDLLYVLASFIGAILIHTALDNISKIVKSNLMKDRFNIENESFEQNKTYEENAYSVNLPIQYYYKKKVHKGWLNLLNPFRATLIIGTPGSGKTFSFIQPYIKQVIGKGFSAFVYDFKYPDLGKMTYYHYLVNKKKGILEKHKFHVINLNEVEYSRRVNPLNPNYLKSLADATETSDALVQALKKSDGSSGTDQFFTQSAVNMLSCVIYFLSRYKGGKYSSLPHVLSFMNRSYDELFQVLYSEPELQSLLSPFKSAHEKKAYDQLEGQLGTLKINISRLATKETYWVFSGDDFNLKISDPKDPSILVVANDPDTQEINSACYSVVLNRLTKLVNKKGNLPVTIAVDELPTLYIHRIENLIATARSNKVAILLGLQELPQFRQQYGKQTADTICSVIANIISGQVRNKETLDWLEKLFGRVKQLKTGLNIDRSRTSISMNEQLDHLIPASKISSLRSGQLVAQIAQESNNFDGKHILSTYNCKVDLNVKRIIEEEKKYKDLPKFYNFGTEKNKKKLLTKNMIRINNEIEDIINSYKQMA